MSDGEFEQFTSSQTFSGNAEWSERVAESEDRTQIPISTVDCNSPRSQLRERFGSHDSDTTLVAISSDSDTVFESESNTSPRKKQRVLEEPRFRQQTLQTIYRTPTASKSSARKRLDFGTIAAEVDSKNSFYCHCIVYFKKNKYTFANREQIILYLEDLRKKASNYFVKYNTKYSSSEKNFIVATHYFDSDAAAGRFVSEVYARADDPHKYNFGDKFSDDPISIFNEREFLDATDYVNPHLHIVYWKTTRNSNAGFNRIFNEWNKLVLGQNTCAIASSERVKCFHCLRVYLHQGKGRFVDKERIAESDRFGLSSRECQIHTARNEANIYAWGTCDTEQFNFVDE